MAKDAALDVEYLEEWIRRLGLGDDERLAHLVAIQDGIRNVQLQVIRENHPDASDAEVEAIWVGETCKDGLDPEFLKGAHNTPSGPGERLRLRAPDGLPRHLSMPDGHE